MAVVSAIRESGLIPYGSRVLIALSGGADSTALLCGLHDLRSELALTLRAVHVNHGLRGEESLGDEQFCRALCARLEIPLVVRPADVRGEAMRTHTSVELAARNLRYRIFAEEGQDHLIATAHTACDQTETVLLNLTRGTGLAGLCGIPQRRGNIIRPMLALTREEILQDLARRGQTFVDDSSNQSDMHTRNRLRHHVVPRLMGENPALHRTVSMMTQQLSAEQAYLNEQTEAAYQACLTAPDTLDGLLSCPTAIRRRCIAKLLETAGIPRSFALITAAEEMLSTGGTREAAKGIYLSAADGILRLAQKESVQEISAQEMKIGENNIFSGKICLAELVEDVDSIKNENVHNKFTNNTLDYDKIIGVAVFRRYRRNDRISLPNRGFTASVRKLVQEKIPVAERGVLHCLADDAGVIWMEQIGAAERVQPDRNTARLLTLTVTADHKTRSELIDTEKE